MIQIDKCYYINLPEREDRKKFIELEIKKSKVLSSIYERFEAIDGMSLHPRDLPRNFLSEKAIKDILMDTAPAWGLSITQGALGVYLSYFSLFEIIKNTNNSCVIIEDDSFLVDDFDDILLKIKEQLPNDFDICYLGYGEDEIENEKFSENLVIPTGKITCLPGLIVSPSGARKLLDILVNVSSQIDTEIYMKLGRLKAFASTYKIAQVKNTLGSNIQGNKNCIKKYKKQNYIFSTFAYGDLANTNAMKLALDLSFFDQKILIITNKPGFFKNLKNVIEVSYPYDYFSYNKRYLCFEEGFKIEDAVVCLDADCRVFYKNYEDTYTNFFVNIKPGFHPSFCWGGPENFFAGRDYPPRAKGYGELAMSICKKLEINTSLAKHWQEGFLIMSKENSKECLFLETWKQISNELDDFEKKHLSQKIGVGEGHLIGLSFIKSKMTEHGPEMCNTLGKDIFYNFYGVDRSRHPDRKVVKATESKLIAEGSKDIDFKEKKIDLSYRIYESTDGLLVLNFDWNKKNNIECLDHEFKINDQIYHFNSDKNNEFIFNKKEELFEILHSYDWYGEKKWESLCFINTKAENHNDVEIHSLICNKDTPLAINCIKSLISYEEFANYPIYLHDDGSLNDYDKEVLSKLSKNIFLIDRKTADRDIKPFLEGYPNCLRYRLGEKKDVYLWHKIKSFDYFFFSKSKKILGIDSDLLFINKPHELIGFIKKSTPCYFPDIQSAYSFNEPKNEIPVLPNVNTGLIFIPGEEYYNINSIENALSNLIRNEINYFPSWIEQSAFAHMFYKDGRYKSLDKTKNRIPFFQEVDMKNSECLHFVSFPDVRKVYKNYIDKMSFSKDSKKIYENSFLVGFKSKKIPLSINISEDAYYYSFDFDWNISDAKIDALSHHFKIKLDEDEEKIYEFGSNKNGFFITRKPISRLRVYHTYEWYGEKNWEKIYDA